MSTCEQCAAVKQALRERAEKAEADAKVIGDRAWNHAIARVINELHNMKIEDAQRLADRIRALRTTEAPRGNEQKGKET